MTWEERLIWICWILLTARLGGIPYALFHLGVALGYAAAMNYIFSITSHWRWEHPQNE